MKKLIFLFLIILSKTFATGIYENKKIDKIQIVVENNNYSKEKILSSLDTKKGDLFSQETFDKDLKKLSQDFDKVIPNISLYENELLISINLYPKPKISKISFSGNQVITTKKLQKQLNIQTNDIFDREVFNKNLEKVKEFYLKRGFFESEIKYKIKKDENNVEIAINVYEGKCGKIKDIIFEGFTKEEESELRTILYSKKYNILHSWFTGRGIFKKDAFEYDLMTIINFLNNKGYADAKVEPKFIEDKKTHMLIIKFIADKGILYHFGDITFSGNKLFNNEQIENQILIKKGNPFSFEKIRNTAQNIKDLYGQKGYSETQVFQETYLLENSPAYDVDFKINEGDQFKVGIIHIIGNKQTKPNVILRESLITPGEIFNTKKLEATKQRLENIGYFKTVNVYSVKSKDSPTNNYKDVYIEIEETTTGSAHLSLGFSELNNIFGNFELTERNFNLEGLLSMFKKGPSSLRGAGEYVNAKVTIGKKQRSYLLSWVDPYFKDTLWRFGIELSKTFSKLQSNDYKVITYGSSVFTSYPLTNYLTFGSKYRLRHSATYLKHRKESKKDKEIEDSHGLISAIGVFLSYDSTNRIYKPTKGIRSSIDTEFSGVGGDFYFVKLKYLNSLFFPIWEKGTAIFKGNIQFIEPVGKTNKNDLPLSEKFFLGGETTVRGYKPYILGPRRPNNPDDPIGGISSCLLSTEYMQSIFQRLDLFVFFDAGCVSKKHFSIPKLNASYGIGARLEIMNRVPLILGYGIPINPDRKEDERKFFFSFGGKF